MQKTGRRKLPSISGWALSRRLSNSRSVFHFSRRHFPCHLLLAMKRKKRRRPYNIIIFFHLVPIFEEEEKRAPPSAVHKLSAISPFFLLLRLLSVPSCVLRGAFSLSLSYSFPSFSLARRRIRPLASEREGTSRKEA